MAPRSSCCSLIVCCCHATVAAWVAHRFSSLNQSAFFFSAFSVAHDWRARAVHIYKVMESSPPAEPVATSVVDGGSVSPVPAVAPVPAVELASAPAQAPEPAQANTSVSSSAPAAPAQPPQAPATTAPAPSTSSSAVTQAVSSSSATASSAAPSMSATASHGVVLVSGSVAHGMSGRKEAVKDNDGVAARDLYNFHVFAQLRDLPVTAIIASSVACHYAALLTDGSMFVWGRNDKGQLGLGHLRNIYVPVRLSGGPWAGAAVGRGHSLFLARDGAVWAAGDCKLAQCGLGEKDAPVLKLTRVPDLANIVKGAHTRMHVYWYDAVALALIMPPLPPPPPIPQLPAAPTFRSPSTPAGASTHAARSKMACAARA